MSSATVTRFASVMMSLVIGLTFLFGFGNVLHLALSIGVPMYVAPLVAPAVDLTVRSLLVGTRHLTVCGMGEGGLKPARRLLLASSVVTLALNVAEPVVHGTWGKAAFDAVGPLLLIDWPEVGPGLLRALQSPFEGHDQQSATFVTEHDSRSSMEPSTVLPGSKPAGAVHCDEDELLECTRREDSEHRRLRQRPISVEKLWKRLAVGASRSRTLVAAVRAEIGE
ncbi:hypothetical protein [Sciscionella marina]|uniref:hypothetical protein n=1 Tax=Sciscionella marina TaxID=508770 RepID=UPI0006879E81|nr:hypothetical protein [Sciscionella marina]